MRKVMMVAVVAALSACKASPDAAPPRADDVPAEGQAKAGGDAAATTAVALDGAGLRFIDKGSGKASLLAFGTPRAQAESALERVAGAADDRSANEECGAGPVQFTRFDAMTLNFQDGRFVGWFLGDEAGATAYSTVSGIAIGATRAKAAQSVSIIPVEGSTLGEEFRIGTGNDAMGGLFAAGGNDERIEALFAGTNCFFR